MGRGQVGFQVADEIQYSVTKRSMSGPLAIQSVNRLGQRRRAGACYWRAFAVFSRPVGQTGATGVGRRRTHASAGSS
jgi:hypothetical protein